MSQTITKAGCRVPTQYASRYLQQLCKHWAHKFEVSFDASHGRIAMPEDRELQMTASAEALELQVSAPTETMAQFQHVIDSHIARFAFREELVFDWQPAL